MRAKLLRASALALDSRVARDTLTQAYKHLTLAILGLIFIAMLGYVSLFVFFMVSASWGAPAILSFGHEHVIAARRNWLDLKLRLVEIESRNLALTLSARDLEVSRMLAEGWMITLKANLERELAVARLEQSYLSEARVAVDGDHGVVKKLSADLGAEARPENELRSGLIDRLRFLAEKVQETELVLRITSLSIALGEITVKERQALEKIASLEAIGQFLGAFAPRQIANSTPQEVAREHGEVLARVSVVDFAKLDRSVKDLTLAAGYSEQRQQLENQLQELKAAQHKVRDALLAIETSPIIQAFDKPTVVVFAPYSNLANFAQGQPVYACRFFLLFCWEAGKVGRLVDGEALVPHPMFRYPIRGQFLELDLLDPSAAKFDVLHVGRRPLFVL